MMCREKEEDNTGEEERKREGDKDESGIGNS